MVFVILFQKSESSLGLGSGAGGGMMTARGAANLLTRLTAVLAALFFALNLWLVILAKQEVASQKLLTASEEREVVPASNASKGKVASKQDTAENATQDLKATSPKKAS